MRLTIEKLVYGGDGLARLPADEHGRGKAVFVPFVLEGEPVEAALVEENRGFARARAEEILQPSLDRIKPACPYFYRCGGCQYQHASYAHQISTKAAILKENLRRIAKVELDSELVIHASPEWNYRNRTRLKVQTDPEFALGYYKFNSHDLLAVEQCPISSPLINQAIAALWQAGRAAKLPREVQEIEFFSNAEDDQLLIEVYCAREITTEAAKEIADGLHAVPQTCGVIVFRGAVDRGAERIASAGANQLTYKTGNHSFRVSAGSFFQVNRYLIDELAALVSDGHSGQLVLDLYAGVGLFAAALSRSFAQVIAVESSPTSFSDLLYNASPNTRAIHTTTDQFLRDKASKLRADLVVVDPPRGGLGEVVVRGLASLGARQITYVSCDPATLSRDLAGLLGSGYRIQRAHMVDLFPQTYHLESVIELTKIS